MLSLEVVALSEPPLLVLLEFTLAELAVPRVTLVVPLSCAMRAAPPRFPRLTVP